MKRIFKIFSNRFGMFGFVRLFFYPVTALFTTPVRLWQTLWNCRILKNDDLNEYSHFNVFAGMDYFCYWVIALSLQKYKHTGYSPNIGLGKHPLTRFFLYSLVPLYPYWKASTVVLLVSMFAWLFMHLVWLNCVPVYWVLLVIFLAVISTAFYGNVFSLQNYNVIGWIFFPLGLYAMFTGNWIVAVIAWILVSFGSLTATALAGAISLAYAFKSFSLLPLFIFLPAGLKLLFHFYPVVIKKDLKLSFLSVMRGLGAYRIGTKYKYKRNAKDLFRTLYFLVIYLQFFVVYYLMSGELPGIFLVGLFIVIVNSSLFLRFLDMQSEYMLMFSLATVKVMQVQDIWLLISYWILINPLPLLVPFPFMKKVFDIVPVLAPFSIKKIKADMEYFLAQVKPKERVLMAFNNPQGEFQKLFDGYRALIELPHYIAAQREFHFMPDFWAVFELNYEGAADFWGRDFTSVLKNVNLWKADYVVIYQDAGTQLNLEWEAGGFQKISKFSWIDHAQELKGIRPYDGEPPDWWLLRKPSNLNNIGGN